jgi:hypothetical protein
MWRVGVPPVHGGCGPSAGDQPAEPQSINSSLPQFRMRVRRRFATAGSGRSREKFSSEVRPLVTPLKEGSIGADYQT